jgi:hypothetical protein
MAFISIICLGKDELITPIQKKTIKEEISNKMVSKEKIIKKPEVKSLNANVNFSSLLNDKYFFGFIGKNYRKLEIRFNSAIKDKNNPQIYLISGKSRVGKNVCEFTGEIRIKSTNIKNFIIPTDPEEIAGMSDCTIENWRNLKEYGTISGEYIFNESKKDKSSGVFKGSVDIYFYKLKDGTLGEGDPTSTCNDGDNPQSYTGQWTQYNSSTVKKANWGKYRIPDSGDLDVGAGEFMPNKKYNEQGWKNFYDHKSKVF